jgi:hypothetical protein
MPDAVIMLEPKMQPTLETNSDQIRTGNIGTTFYDLIYYNQKTNNVFENQIIGEKLLR